MSRWIGIRHRTKRLVEGKARPTQIYIISSDGKTVTYDLAKEEDELMWVLGKYSWRKTKGARDGLKPGDKVGMILGGSGDRLAFAFSRRAEELGNGTQILRIRSSALKEWREKYGREKDEDAQTLAELVRDHSADFFPVIRRDRDLIRLGEAWRNRNDATKARIGAEQRFLAHLTGQIFCSEEGKYPEGEIELLYQEQRSNDRIIQALLEEEKERDKEVEAILRDLPVYTELLSQIKGVGPMIAARLIVAIGDIRRFKTDAKLKAFLGVHVKNGKLPRRRAGEQANWQQDGRQALWLFVTEQCNLRPNSEWGKKLREYKTKLREKHPVVECSQCEIPWEQCEKTGNGRHVQKYSKIHIQKMASWRTATKFVEWLWAEWTRLEKGINENPAG